MDFGSINTYTVISKIPKGVNTIGDLFMGVFCLKNAFKNKRANLGVSKTVVFENFNLLERKIYYY
jgi:hypothetical protein